MDFYKVKIRVFSMLISLLITLVALPSYASSTVTWDPVTAQKAVVSDDNLTVNISSLGGGAKATHAKEDGKWYWEVKFNEGRSLMVGIINSNSDVNTSFNSQDTRLYYYDGKIYPGAKSYGGSFGAGTTIGVALDLDNGTIEFYKNGQSQGIAFDNLETMGKVCPFITSGSSHGGPNVTANFGAIPFEYEIPEGYSPYQSTQTSTPSGIVLDIEPEKEKIKINEEVYADLTINNIKEIAAEDIRIKYDNEKLQFTGFEEVEGIKLVKSIEDTGNGELRVILASKGEANIINAKQSLLRLKFKGIKAGEAKVDIIKGRVSDGVEMEKDLTDEECDEGIIIVEGIKDVNNSGEFTLLDLAIDARHLNKDPNSLPQYNTDIVVNGAIDEDDLLEIGRLMLENPNYTPNI